MVCRRRAPGNTGRRRHRPGAGRQPALDHARRRQRLRPRHAVHGLAFDAGATARAAAVDPVTAAVRLLRRAAGLGRGTGCLHRLQRIQSGPRDRRTPPAGRARRRQRPGGDDHLCRAGRRDRSGGLPLDTPGTALRRLRDDRAAAGLYAGCGQRPAFASRRLAVRQVPGDSVHGAVLCGGRVPVELVDLRVGLLALPAARRQRALVVLLDVHRRFHRRRVDDARRHAGRGIQPARWRFQPRCKPRAMPYGPDWARRCSWSPCSGC